MADDPKATEEQTENPTEPQEPSKDEGAEATKNVTDSHGQPGINKERHDKEVAELNAKIADLESKVAEAAKTEENRDKLSKEIADLKAEMAETKVVHKLEMAGCKDIKAAKARLEDFDGDVDKLKDACPYLFGDEKKTGTTGLKPAGAPSDHEQRVKMAREAAGLPPKKG